MNKDVRRLFVVVSIAIIAILILLFSGYDLSNIEIHKGIHIN